MPDSFGSAAHVLDELAKRRQRKPHSNGTDAEAATEGANPYSETALADDFVNVHGNDARYVAALGTWLHWTGTHWEQDDAHGMADAFTAIARGKAEALRLQALDTGNSTASLQRTLLSRRYREGGEAIARTMPALAIPIAAPDALGHLLNTPAGTIDLRDGSTRPHARADLISRCTRVAPDGRGIAGTRFARFLHEITDGDDGLAEYPRRALGACLFASNADDIAGDHWMLFCFGVGRNGKNTLLDACKWTLANYAKAAPADLLIADLHGNRHPTEVASLHGARLAICSETEEGARWNDVRLKSLTGDATLVARKMGRDFFEFPRTHRLIVHGNHRPLLANPDPAIRARLHLVPFAASFIGREEPGLDATLRSEAGRILDWMLQGAADYFEAGKLHRCSAVERESTDYFDAQSTFDAWLAERTEADEAARTHSRELYGDFATWKRDRGEGVQSMTRWGEEMGRRYKRTNRRGIIYHGIRLRVPGTIE